MQGNTEAGPPSQCTPPVPAGWPTAPRPLPRRVPKSRRQQTAASRRHRRPRAQPVWGCWRRRGATASPEPPDGCAGAWRGRRGRRRALRCAGCRGDCRPCRCCCRRPRRPYRARRCGRGVLSAAQPALLRTPPPHQRAPFAAPTPVGGCSLLGHCLVHMRLGVVSASARCHRFACARLYLPPRAPLPPAPGSPAPALPLPPAAATPLLASPVGACQHVGRGGSG